MLSLGLDIGGSKTEALVLDSAGQEVFRRRYATVKDDLGSFLERIVFVIDDVRAALGAGFTIGVCMPGVIVTETGNVKNSNILVLNGQPFPAMLENACGRKVAFANDGNCFALSEAIDGAGREYAVVFGLTLGTGCGGGVVFRRTMHNGRNCCAGEWGHASLPRYTPEKDGPAELCYCGQYNCSELFLSGTGLARRFQLRFGRALTAPEIFAEYTRGDADARRHIELYQDQLARALADVVNLLDPDVFVIGGGLSSLPFLYDGMSERIAAYVFGRSSTTPVVPARHGGASGVRGAAWLGSGIVSPLSSPPVCDNVGKR
ncbi:MAG: ROK family protein [Methylobacteriaceae bacterium]|jgi:fructokinase|nr:ROK family protein [Methylobacteriaceae bacterium]